MGNCCRSLKDKCPCTKSNRPENRTVYVGNNVPGGEEVIVPEKYPSNRVISSKYTAWNFIPVNLFEQFQRIANFYFLCVGIVELIIDSPVSPLASFVPLAFVVIVTAIKQAYEDWLRHKADREVNDAPADINRDGQLETVKSMEINVGDIVRVGMNGDIPCDMVMLASDNPEGDCYITTANLDGETSLKTFFAVHDSRDLQTVEELNNFRGTIECEQPITDLYRFTGRIHVQQSDGTTELRSLNAQNVLLRGSRLKNTSFIFGCCVYSGQETKMALNSKIKGKKFSTVERAMNRYLIAFLILLCVESGLLTGLKHWFYSFPENQESNMWYAQGLFTSVSFINVLEEFLAFMVLLNYIIPISLYVTVELQKFFSAMFFRWDVEMYDVQTNEPAKANTSDINEELGQVEYLFTDKTGTLTENDMQFRQCSVKGVQYEEIQGTLCVKSELPDVEPSPLKEIPPELETLWTVLGLCHTCRVDSKDHQATGTYSTDGAEYEYQASSPDEKALVEVCRRNGVVFHGMRDNRAEVSYHGEMKRYVMHHILDFDPTRKRMSVIVENGDGSAYLMVKGAETAILPRVDFKKTTPEEVEIVEKHIHDFAVLGLRTLVIAQRKLSEEEFSKFDRLLRDAKETLENREDKLDEAFDIIENGLELVGATAVEDKLQDGVPETISSLRMAGIQVWVLTGDKEETAVNVSYSAGHFFKDVIEIRCTHQESVEQCGDTLERIKEQLDEASKLGQPNNHALIVDGMSLAYTLDHHDDLLRSVCQKVVTVLCCRMSPIQKAKVVKLMKHSKDRPTTAAIGDGANDVSMIQEADVGLGLMGKEGRQAVRSSDYAFGRFKFLKRALLLHGHYYYVRLANLVNYCFYKNVAFITCQFYFSFWNAFLAQSLYDSLQLALFNVTMSSLPILIYGCLEKSVPKQHLLDNPLYYRRLRKNALLSPFIFILWTLLGVFHSLVFYFGSYFLFSSQGALQPDGKMYGVYEFGTFVYSCVVFAVNVKLMLEWYYWTGVTFFSFILTFAGYFLLCFVYSSVIWGDVPVIGGILSSEYSLYGTYLTLFGSGTIWLGMLIICMIALLPDICMRAFRDTLNPIYRGVAASKKVKHEEPVLMSVSFTKHSGDVQINKEAWSHDDNANEHPFAFDNPIAYQ